MSGCGQHSTPASYIPDTGMVVTYLPLHEIEA